MKIMYAYYDRRNLFTLRHKGGRSRSLSEMPPSCSLPAIACLDRTFLTNNTHQLLRSDMASSVGPTGNRKNRHHQEEKQSIEKLLSKRESITSTERLGLTRKCSQDGISGVTTESQSHQWRDDLSPKERKSVGDQQEEPKRKISHKTLEFVYDEKRKTSALVAEREVERNDFEETTSSVSEHSPVVPAVGLGSSPLTDVTPDGLTLENIKSRPEESTREKTFRLLKWILDDQDRFTN